MARGGTRRAIPVKAASAPRRSRMHRIIVSTWIAALVIGGIGLVDGMIDGPDLFSGLGATAVLAALTWGLTVRSGSRSPWFTALAAIAGLLTVTTSNSVLDTATAVTASSVAAVFAVMATIPATTYLRTLGELAVALGISLLGSLTALGFQPSISMTRYQVVVVVIAVLSVFVLVYQLGAGFHGLGRRGTVFTICGGVLLAIFLAYTILLRSYANLSGVENIQSFTDWLQQHLHGYPRPSLAIVGIPALLLGVHMRSRRRQGWWVSAFGVAMSAPVATTLASPVASVPDAVVNIGYSLVIGVLIGWALIRVDLTVTRPPRGHGKRAATPPGRRAAIRPGGRAVVAVRPEPSRTKPLF